MQLNKLPRSCAGVVMAAMAGLVALPVAAQDKNVTLQGIPSATVAPHGLAFVSVAGSTLNVQDQQVEDNADVSVVMGFGVGSAEESVGFQISASITSIAEGFADSGFLSFKASHRLQAVATPTYIGLGVDHLAHWGDFASEYEPTTTLMVTSFPRVEIAGEMFPLMVTVGAGTHIRDNSNEPGVFFGAGIGLTPDIGLSLAWNGDYVSLGTAFNIGNFENVAFTASVDDIFDMEDSRRLTLSATFFVEDLFGR